jgi:hypothetical protein
MGFRSAKGGLVGAENLKLITEISDKRKNENLALATLRKDKGFSYLIQTEGKSSLVDNTGAVGTNKNGFDEVSQQGEIHWMIKNAFVKGDSAYITRASTAFVYAFDRQNVAGYFNNGLGLDATVAIEADTFFMSSFMCAYYTIAREPALAAVKTSYDSYAPKIAASLAWLEANKAYVYAAGANTPNRLLFAAVAYYLGGTYLGSTTYRSTGEDLAATAIGMQHADGYFLEKGGYDSSYQAVNLFNLCFLYLNSTDTSLRSQLKVYIEAAVDWLITRISSTGANAGEVSTVGNTRTGPTAAEYLLTGHYKAVNYGEVSLALYYSGFILGRSDLVQYGYLTQLYVYTHS